MESEEINSNPIENNEEEVEEEVEEGQEIEEGNEKNNLNILVKEENVERDEPPQEIKMSEDKPEDNKKEEEEEKEGKEEEEVEEEIEEENEAKNEAQNEGQNDRENEGEIELKIKKNDEYDEENLEEENNIKEDKELPIEESGDKVNEEASKGSEENVEEELEHEQKEDEKEEILVEKKNTQNFNLKGTEVSATYFEDKDNINIVFKKSSCSPNLILHWGLFKEYPINEWHHPSKENYPKNTKEFDTFALETEFADDGKESTIEFELPKNDAKGISFVFYNPNMNEWHNNNWRDFQIFFSN